MLQPNFRDLLGLTKAEAVKKVQTLKGAPTALKLALAGGLAMLTDEDYFRYVHLITEGLAALEETERGRRLLEELGFANPTPA